MDILKRISRSLQQGLDAEVGKLTAEAIAERLTPKNILDEGLIGGMNVVGDRFRRHEIFLPDVLLAAKAMYAGLNQLKPLLVADEVPMLGKVVIGSVQGDLHDIGKNLVGIMLEGAGFEVVNLGNDVQPERFVEAAGEQEAGVIGMSALLTTTMTAMGRVVELVRREGLDGRVKTIIGGAPVSGQFAEQIGADAYGYDAANAVVRVKELVGIQ